MKFETVLFRGAVHEGILPLPAAANPMSVFEFIHVNVEPAGVLTKLPILTSAPEHTPIFVIGLTIGEGKMVTVKLIGVPGHPLRVGVTVIIPVISVPEVLEGATHEAIFPEPLKAIPIAVFELDQVNEPPTGLLPKFPILIV